MNIVLNSHELELKHTDIRLARCKHPRLRQALMFHPPLSQTGPSMEKPQPSREKIEPLTKRQKKKPFQSVTSLAATTLVRVMNFLFDGFHFVTTPL